MPAQTKTTQVNLRLTPALKAAAEKAAGRDHRSLTSLIEKLLTEYLQTQPALDDWHERARARFFRLASEHRLSGEIAMGAAAKSFCIKSAHGERIGANRLGRELQLIYGQLSNSFKHAAYFHPYTRRGLVPYYTSDPELKRAGEILECFVSPPAAEAIEFWRVSPEGLAFDMRPYAEDRDAYRQQSLEPGKWFSPYFLTRDLEIFTRFATELAAKIPSAETVEFRCEWHGLMNRYAAAGEQGRFWAPANISRTDHCITRGEWAIAEVRSSWPAIASALGGPVVRLFDPTFDYSPDWVKSQGTGL
jgi:hypothetical protein